MKKAHKYVKYAVTMMLAACMMLSPLTGAATAFAAELPETEVTETEVPETEEGPLYVLMNIPYDEFYEAEGVDGVDAVSTATVKTFNQTMAAGSYHDGYLVPDNIPGTDDAEILGVTYPVLVTDPSVLEGLTKVTDESTATITVAAGKSSLTTKEVTGIDVLFASPSYAYYVLADEPSSYKELTVQDGSFSFGAATAAAASETLDAEPSVSYTGHHTQIEISVSDEVISNSSKVNAVVMTTADGVKYALQHVVHVWRKSELGWNYDMFDLGGKTITSFKYYTETADENGNVSYAITDYAVNIPIKANTDAVLTAAFDSAEQISVTGLPEDAADPVATVESKVGRGETPVVIAENVPVTDGKIAVADPVDGTTYIVTIISDNYKDLQAEAVYESAVPEAEAVTLDKTSEELVTSHKDTGDSTLQLTAVVTPEQADQTVTWTSSDEAVATVDANGLVTALTYGKTVITAKTANGLSASCEIQTRYYDVADSGAYWFRHVYWAADHSITKGYDNIYFGPEENCKREQMITFLYREAGSPAVSGTVPFPDVKKGSYYYNAVLWAYKNNITKGYSSGPNKGKFGVGLEVSREDTVTFIYRMAGKPSYSTTKSFTDVKKGAYYYDAVRWAAQNGIANGYSSGPNKGKFGVGFNVLRKDIVTFLSRYDSMK